MRKLISLMFLLLLSTAANSALLRVSYQGPLFQLDDQAPDGLSALTAHFIIDDMWVSSGYLPGVTPRLIAAEVNELSVLEWQFSDGHTTITSDECPGCLGQVHGSVIFEEDTWAFHSSSAEFDIDSPNAGSEGPGDFYLMNMRAIYTNIITGEGFFGDVVGYCSANSVSGCTRGGYEAPGEGTWAISTVVPIPAAAYLFGSALLGLGWLRRKA